MSFSVDQFLQVKCKFQLTSETDSSESICSNNERVRLCTSVDFDKNSSLIVMICSNEISNNHILTYYIERRQHSLHSNLKPKTIIKQIYYHNYNEDIVAINLSGTGNKLVLVSVSSTIYIIPVKNILLNLHAKQLRSSQGRSMYFYDASILNCCQLEDPVAVAYSEDCDMPSKSMVIVANHQGAIDFLNVESRTKIISTSVHEPVNSIKIIRDKLSVTLLITCESFNQYRYALDMVGHQESSFDSPIVSTKTQSPASPQDMSLGEEEISYPMDKKPILVKMHSAHVHKSSMNSIHRVFVPSNRIGRHTSILHSLKSRDKSLHLIMYPTTNVISVVDVLGYRKMQSPSVKEQAKEPRLVRFYSSKQYYYRPQKPILVCKLSCLETDELITQVVLTDRFLVVATDRDRCLINSKNLCNLKNTNNYMDLDPLVKEISFSHDEKIMLLMKSPASRDQDNVIDSFLLVTTKSIYTIEARQGCRDMFINLIDSHLNIRPVRSKSQQFLRNSTPFGFNFHELIPVDEYESRRKNSESNLMIDSFLCHRADIYERIIYDSRAFSLLFKLELNSLYEAYGDKSLTRSKFELANRFFQMAQFNHTKILGKYIRLGAYKQTVNYINNVLSNDNEILEESERIELARAGFECLLAKTLVERSKLTLYKTNMSSLRLKQLLGHLNPKSNNETSNPNPTRLDPFRLCEHSPRCQVAKLSSNTIIVDSSNNNLDDDEATLTTENNRTRKLLNRNTSRLECESSLVEFVGNSMPTSLHPYVINRLIDFDLTDLLDTIVKSDARICDLIKVLSNLGDGRRAVFRDTRYLPIMDKLESTQASDLIKIDINKPKLLEFLTSDEVTQALVKNIGIASDYLGYPKSSIQFRKYSHSAIVQMSLLRKLISVKVSGDQIPNEEKKKIERIFMEFLTACLEESTEDSCRLWFNYINFYLNFVGTIDELEGDILNLLDVRSDDCRIAITLYKSIGLSETKSSTLSTRPVGFTDNANNPLSSMKTIYDLDRLFKNEFLMRVLEKTLNLVPKSSNLNALSDCLGVDGLTGSVSLPVENAWRQILKTIQSATLAAPQQREFSSRGRHIDSR